MRRLFYVARFAAVAVLGKIPNPVYIKDNLRAMVFAVSSFEKTGSFQIPLARFDAQSAFERENEYVVMTKKGLYLIGKDKFEDLEDIDTQSFGTLAGVFNVVYSKMKNIEQSLAMMRAHSSFLAVENIAVTREQLGDTFDLTTQDEFEISFEVKPR